MPLTVAAQLLIDQLALAFPSAEVMTVEGGRAPVPAAAPDSDPRLAVNDDVLADDDGPPLAVRCYRPAATDQAPGIVFFHGGGFVFGDLDSHDGLCRALALATDAVVVAVDYRLAPEHLFPVAADDAWRAVRAIDADRSRFGIDGSPLAVAGDSAGGNLVLNAAISAREAGAPAIGCQLLFYPVADLTCSSDTYDTYAEGYFLTAAHMHWFRDHYLGVASPLDPRASPLYATVGGLPPVTMILAECDVLRGEGEALATRLRLSGVEVTEKVFAGMFHGFASMSGLLPEADEAIAFAADRFKRSAVTPLSA